VRARAHEVVLVCCRFCGSRNVDTSNFGVAVDPRQPAQRSAALRGGVYVYECFCTRLTQSVYSCRVDGNDVRTLRRPNATRLPHELAMYFERREKLAQMSHTEDNKVCLFVFALGCM
jgi:hypothetical protein